MNPVDHVRPTMSLVLTHNANRFSSLTVVVTTSISVRPRPSPATPHKVKRPVSLPPGGLVCSVVRKRRRSRGSFNGLCWRSLVLAYAARTASDGPCVVLGQCCQSIVEQADQLRIIHAVSKLAIVHRFVGTMC